jgi:hypothetical protein
MNITKDNEMYQIAKNACGGLSAFRTGATISSLVIATLGCRHMVHNKVNILSQFQSWHLIDVTSAGLIDINLIHYGEWHISTHTLHHFGL